MINQISIEEIVEQIGFKEVIEIIHRKLKADPLSPEEQIALKKLLTKL